MEKYIMTSNTYFANRSYTFYGIALVVVKNEQLEVLEEYNCLTEDKLQVEHLVSLCNELKPQGINLYNIVEDFIVSKNKL